MFKFGGVFLDMSKVSENRHIKYFNILKFVIFGNAVIDLFFFKVIKLVPRACDPSTRRTSGCGIIHNRKPRIWALLVLGMYACMHVCACTKRNRELSTFYQVCLCLASQ